ncbi:MAG TPA: hypothetical protein V6C81_20955 [Planktothrix sp.]|jgi:hypothetical protein
MANSQMHESWSKYSHYRVLVPFVAVALATPFIPLQRMITLGRFQHYAIALGILSFGYFVHCGYTWTRLMKWGRIATFVTGLFFASIAYIFWTNPWLDLRVAVQTDERDRFRLYLMIAYLVSATAIFLIWNCCRKEEQMRDKGGEKS